MSSGWRRDWALVQREVEILDDGKESRKIAYQVRVELPAQVG